jgi:hypothetical protein
MIFYVIRYRYLTNFGEVVHFFILLLYYGIRRLSHRDPDGLEEYK